MRPTLFTLALLALAPLSGANEDAIASILAVGAEGKGNPEAAAGWSALIASPTPDALLASLRAMDKASPLAANWLRSASEVIAADCASNGTLPTVGLGEFLLDRSHAPKARRFAFELIQKSDPETASALVPGMLNDPSPELRRDAVARLIDQAETLGKADKKSAATVIYRQALGAAVEPSQIKPIADALKELGAEVDLPKHFGFLMRWHVCGPFGNVARSGFDTVNPPELGSIDLKPADDGQIKWQPLASSDAFGKIDLNKPFGMLKEKLAYAYTEFEAPAARAAELRIGTKNAFKVWLNGELVFARDEYHRGQRIDQYQLPVQLTAGKNTILVKACQNEQKEEWTVQWEFQLRVCDATGTAILANNRLPTPEPENARSRRRPRKP